MAKDKDYIRMIHTARWLRLRRETLNAHPLCVRCAMFGRTSAATEVHHIRPVEEARTAWAKEARMFDPNNLAALCHECHIAEHTAMGRTGKAAARRINGERLRDFYARFFGEKDDEGGGGFFGGEGVR